MAKKPNEKKSKKGILASALKTVLVFWLVLGVAAGVYFFSVFIRSYYAELSEKAEQESSVDDSTPKIPYLKDMLWNDSLKASLENGEFGFPISVTVAYNPDSTAPAGSVLAQHPAPYSEARLDEDGVCRSLTVTVSGKRFTSKYESLVGYPADAAFEWLRKCGIEPINVKRVFETNPDLEDGTVLYFGYADGTELALGTTVSDKHSYTITVNSRVLDTTVPEMTAGSLDGAKEALFSAMLNLGTVTFKESGMPNGYILSQGYEAGTVVACGEAIDLTVSIYSAQFPMPNLVGFSLESAKETLLKNELMLGTVKEKYDYRYEENTVIEQSVPEGATVYPMDKINLVIAVGGKASDDVNWESEVIFVNLHGTPILGKGTLERLAAECRDKSVYIGIRESYMWSLPKGTFLRSDAESANMGVLFSDQCPEYRSTRDLLEDMGYRRSEFLIFAREDTPELPPATKLEIKLGKDFEDSTVKLLKYDGETKSFTDTDQQYTSDELGYITFTVDSGTVFAAVRVD